MRSEFLAKAKENVQAAEMLFESQLYNASANRAYYAAFQAALAALVAKGIATDRRGHTTIQAQFATELIYRRKMYPSYLRSHLTNLQSVRDDADYKPKSISKTVAQRQLNKAKELVDIVAKELER